MPKRGDTLYKVWNGVLETVTFLEEGIDTEAGATAPTWLVREKGKESPIMGRRIRCTIGMYHTSAKAAWQAELDNYKSGLQYQIDQRKKLGETIKETRAKIIELRKTVKAAA